MKLSAILKKSLFILFTALIYLNSAPSLLSAETEVKKVSPADVLKAAQEQLANQSKQMQDLSQIEGQKREILKQKESEKEQLKKEASSISQQKLLLDTDAKTKEQEAVLAEQEATVLKQRAKDENNEGFLEEAKNLEEKAKQLKQEAEEARSKAGELSSKVTQSQERALASEALVNSLRQELSDIKKEKTQKRPIWDKLIWVVIVLAGGVLALFLMNFIIHKFEEIITPKDILRESEFLLRVKTVSRLFRWAGSLVLVGLILYFSLDHLGLDMTPFIAGAGIIGLAFGFGGQYLIRDLINGIFILIEGQYNINDVVKIGDHGGLVEAINLRVTKLRDLEGRVIYIPNGEIKTVVNFTQEFSQALLNIGVAYKENVDRVMDVIKQIGKEMREDKYFKRLILADLEMLGVDDFADSQITIKFRIKTLPIKQWEVAREFRRRIKNKFDELGIEIPFPHRTLYWGTGNDNDWMKDLMGTSKAAQK